MLRETLDSFSLAMENSVKIGFFDQTGVDSHKSADLRVEISFLTQCFSKRRRRPHQEAPAVVVLFD